MRHHGLPAGDRIRRHGRWIRVIPPIVVEVALSFGLRRYSCGADIAITRSGTRCFQWIYLAWSRRLDSRRWPHGRRVHGGWSGCCFSAQTGQTISEQCAIQILAAQLEVPQCCGGRCGFAASSRGGYDLTAPIVGDAVAISRFLALLSTILQNLGIADNLMGADHVVWFGIELVIAHIVVRLQPYPLLALRKESVVARLALTRLPY